jgi:hypothetical protein
MSGCFLVKAGQQSRLELYSSSSRPFEALQIIFITSRFQAFSFGFG